MTNPFGRNPSYGGLSGAVASRFAVLDNKLPESSLLTSSRYLSATSDRNYLVPKTSAALYSVVDRSASSLHGDSLRSSASNYGAPSARGSGVAGVLAADASVAATIMPGAIVSSAASQALWPSTLTAIDFPGSKRSYEGAHTTLGWNEDWLSILSKRPRVGNASSLPIYPQRPGEKDCAHYMLTRTCKFGDACKFDHPIWVPEGGIPDWKEVPLDPFPERPGEPDCPYFVKTQKCKFGVNCKFNHPKGELNTSETSGDKDASVLPKRPSEPSCSYYMKTGKCKFGANCKFHHPKDIHIQTVLDKTTQVEQCDTTMSNGMAGDAKPLHQPVPAPAVWHNSKGLPIRPGEVACPFYMKTGSCKYGANCRHNHPDRTVINPSAAIPGHLVGSKLSPGVFSPAASILQSLDPRLSQTMLGVGTMIYPQHLGQIECDFYMKSGRCKFGERCKFHHPIDRSAPMHQQIAEESVKLTLAGLPRREGAVHCPFYMKTGSCKYGVNCKFDHPPPGEVMATVAAEGTPTSAGDDKRDDENAVGNQEQKGVIA